VIVVGRVLEVSLESLRHKSRLYDAGFSHGFRESRLYDGAATQHDGKRQS